MKLKNGDVIVFDPTACKTIADSAWHPHFSVGVVTKYDKYAEAWYVDVADYRNTSALICTDYANRNTVRVIGTL